MTRSLAQIAAFCVVNCRNISAVACITIEVVDYLGVHALGEYIRHRMARVRQVSELLSSGAAGKSWSAEEVTRAIYAADGKLTIPERLVNCAVPCLSPGFVLSSDSVGYACMLFVMALGYCGVVFRLGLRLVSHTLC
eukprot:SAG11_NODE_1652_length_4509_cov_3.121088_3_plen_137_part_00